MTTATTMRTSGIPPPKGRMRSDRKQAVVSRAQRVLAEIHVVPDGGTKAGTTEAKASCDEVGQKT
eukprot:gene12519-13803_t